MRGENEKSIVEKKLLLLQRFSAVTRIPLIWYDIFIEQVNREEKKTKLSVSSLLSKRIVRMVMFELALFQCSSTLCLESFDLLLKFKIF